MSDSTENNSNSHLTLADIAAEDAGVYWVTQNNLVEIEDGYLRAKVDDTWHHDLTRLSYGDVVIHNFQGELVGYSTVTSEAETHTTLGIKYYRVEVDLRLFGEPIPIDDELKDELGQEKYRVENTIQSTRMAI